MKRVIIESPYAGNVERNVEYARACMHDSVHRGEAPIASHLLYTQPGILDDGVPEERALGIEAGLAWRTVCELQVFYIDLGFGVSRPGRKTGMQAALEQCKEEGRPYELRTLGGKWAPHPWLEAVANTQNRCEVSEVVAPIEDDGVMTVEWVPPEKVVGVVGLRSLNAPGEVEVRRIYIEPLSDEEHRFDAARLNLGEEHYWVVDMGAASLTSPLCVELRRLKPDVRLKLNVYWAPIIFPADGPPYVAHGS